VVIDKFVEHLRNVYKKPLYTSGGEISLMADIIIENIVVETRIADSLDLDNILHNIPNAEYQPQDIPGIVLQIPSPRSTVILFKNGRLILTGPTSNEQVTEIINIIQSKLLIIGIPRCTNPEITIKHMVTSTTLGNHLKLEAIKKALVTAEYHPKVFPGVIYPTDDPNTIILLFDSGKVVCNGNNYNEIANQLDKLITKLKTRGLV
jgi:transcription initiation factor TFIID TATA-box-binding protein